MLKQFLIGVILFFIFIAGFALASSDPYGDCIKGYDFGVVPTENIVVAPISISCQSLCLRECKLFSRKTNFGIELNNEAIFDCISTCQNGKLFQGYYYEEITNSNGETSKTIKGPISTGVSCQGSIQLEDTIYQSNTDIKIGDQIKLSLVNNDLGNKIYLCGKKTVNLDPMIKSLNSAEWLIPLPPQTVLQNRSDNMCAVTMSDFQWSNLSNNSLWASNNSDKCSWNSRNILFTDTGIWVKDGDELAISWKSTHIFWPKIIYEQNTSSQEIYNRANLYKLLNSTNNSTLKQQIAIVLNKQSSLLFLSPGANKLDPNSSHLELNGEEARMYQLGEIPTPATNTTKSPPPGASWHGLEGSVTDVGCKITPITTGSDCDTYEKRLKNAIKCNNITDPGTPIYSFEGILDGFSTSPTLLALRSFDLNPLINYLDNLGGINVSISWAGCPYTAGQRLQYAITLSKPTNDSSDWKDVPMNVLTNANYIISDSDGKFFLRIKPLPIPSGDLPDDQIEYYKNPAYHSGQYYLNMTKIAKASFIYPNGPIQILVKAIRSTLYGDPNHPENPGALEKLYKSFVKESTVMGAIRAILVLYVALTGLGYIMGIVQMTQYDLIIRIIKFSFVATIISPTSWSFFSHNFFKLFMEGSLELIGKVASGSLQGNFANIIDVSSDPTNIFAIFDGPFKIIFSKELWVKVLALSLSGPMGVLLAILIPVAAAFYFLALAKATLMFLISMVIISLLIFVAPIFLCFMLFRLTKPMFDVWWKFLISFTIQPVAIFTSISIFSILIISTIYTTLSFSVCPSCLFRLQIPHIVNVCIVPVWRILAYSHMPDNVNSSYMPEGVITGTLVLLILTHGMYVFCEFIAGVINRIISGQIVNETSLESYGQAGITSVQSLVGMDEESKYRRYQARQEEQQKQADKPQVTRKRK